MLSAREPKLRSIFIVLIRIKCWKVNFVVKARRAFPELNRLGIERRHKEWKIPWRKYIEKVRRQTRLCYLHRNECWPVWVRKRQLTQKLKKFLWIQKTNQVENLFFSSLAVIMIKPTMLFSVTKRTKRVIFKKVSSFLQWRYGNPN